MISNDNSTDGKSFRHNTGNKGSVCTVRVGSRSLPLYPLVIGCLGLLNVILILTAAVIGIYCGTVSEVSDPHLITAQALIIEVKQLQIMQSKAIKDQEGAQQALKNTRGIHQQLKLQLEQNMTLSDSLQRQLETLQLERAVLMSDSSHIRDSCGRCLSGWLLFNTSCYFHSKSTANPMNWQDSRADCISRGANLAVINSLEEQLNLFEYLPKLDQSINPWWSRPGGIWIGLSDTETEGTFVWINNVTQQDGGYWIPGEPNNYGILGEDCVAIVNIKNPRETWFDADCLKKNEWLCEMEPN